MPGLVRWPGHTQPGQESDEPVCGVDLLPTLCTIAGIPIPTDRAIDGTNFLPLLEGKPLARKTPLYWQYNRAQSQPKVAMRVGDWKILAHLTGPELKPASDIRLTETQAMKVAELSTFELYNLRSDIGETTNLAQREPAKLKELADQLRPLYLSVRDESPVWPDWISPRYEAQRIREGQAKNKPPTLQP